MATGVNYWSSYDPIYKVRESVGGGDWSSEEGGGAVTWETPAMEVKGQLISAPDSLTCPGRKQSERMAALQERRRSLQALLSTRLAELRRICLQEAELTGMVPSDFPLEAGEKPPCVRRRGGVSRQGTRKCRAEEEDCQRSKLKKTLFSSALRKHNECEHNTHSQTHTHHGKKTVHRGCHTDDTVKSESSSTSDSTGHDNDDVSQCRPPLGSAGSPVNIFYQNKTRRNSLHSRTDHPDTKPLPLHPPHCSQESSSSSGPSDLVGEGVVRLNAARRSNSSDGLLDHTTSPEEDAGPQQGGRRANGPLLSRGTNGSGAFRSSETPADGCTRTRPSEGGGRGRGHGGAGYSDVLLDYVWGKQQQLQRQQSHPSTRQPITSQHQVLYASRSVHQPPLGPPTDVGLHGDQRRVKVTRTKSCGPFLPVQADSHNPPLSAIQPDPHPHLLPPRPPMLPPHQDTQLEEATRSLHKALALEGLRDWYLRNTQQNQNQNQVPPSVSAKVNGAVTGQGGGALQRRRTTHGTTHHKPSLPHSTTFHGHPLHGRSGNSSFYYDSFPPLKQEVPVPDPVVDQLSPGTLV